ncbi:DUF2388 domain-containing protein [Pseudomonas sp. G34]|jgi:uncharacterized protein (TIGR02448 family)|uniref:DUF2388 domain-containing protein n=1 Tax=Pseudomonas sp. G34 TaxID=3059083 RepID=UPI0028089371|nr:DUF2388 domain-containing protein [Pseudomonas sp. G34]MDQ7983836.1 DUF2388 domain-containing protein [Pseudomonas sp. G34]
MPIVRTLAFVSLFGFAAGASASSFVVTTDTLVDALAATIDTSSNATSSVVDNKVVLAARDDAASFVASQGAVRGAHLETALQHIRARMPALQADDAQLAQAILAH